MEILKKIKNKLFRKQMLFLVELDKEKFKTKKEGSCDIYCCLPKYMTEEEKKELEQHIHDAINVIRNCMDKKIVRRK